MKIENPFLDETLIKSSFSTKKYRFEGKEDQPKDPKQIQELLNITEQKQFKKLNNSLHTLRNLFLMSSCKQEIKLAKIK